MADVEWEEQENGTLFFRLGDVDFELFRWNGYWHIKSYVGEFMRATRFVAGSKDAAKSEALALVRIRLRESLSAAGEPNHAAISQVVRTGLDELWKYARAARDENEGTDAGNIASNVAAIITEILDVADNCYDIPVEKGGETDG